MSLRPGKRIKHIVPVPAAIWLFATAVIGLAGFGKRSKSESK
ncbi:MAG: VPLPA-CTERM sorting domain-containing protein [Gammaproteobacteria bacterium]|nr:VPLPA-CTERM sorting domain-containing protein [Gammaproteobacteria bacterium]